ncbi:MAG TPA: histidine ammonia-lyase [Actinomycetota bacterium]|nr:histidine ammonia-lyase [Actinomycetota bacterium]
MSVRITGDPLGIADVVAVAREGEHVAVDGAVAERMRPGRALVDAAVEREQIVYGITTGFGALANVRIPREAAVELQHSIVRSHAAGAGEPIDNEIVRGMMLLRARTLAAGHAGARPVLVEAIAALLNAGITPVVPRYGSVGASGDLAPLAHCALALLGEGMVRVRGGAPVPAAEALRDAAIEPVVLEAKEGLALVNGTEGMLSMLSLALHDFDLLTRAADVACAMTVEALLATDRPFAPALHALRPHPGQGVSAGRLRTMTAGSEIIASHRSVEHAVQDAYSLRCAPQVHGACRDTAAHARAVADRELASEVDNPVVLHEIGAVESAGNFHGEPVAFALDFLAIAACELASISERRTDRMLDPAHSNGLPAFLAPDAGVNSGFMLAQYTQAALVSDAKRLAVPSSVDTIPTSGTTEDHVSMGFHAGLKLRQSLANARTVLAIEVLCAAQALDLRAPLKPSPAATAACAVLREQVDPMPSDRELSPQITHAVALLPDLVAAAEAAAGL